MPDQIHCETHFRWIYRPGPYKRKTLYSANDMKELFQNIEIRNVMSFLKAMNIYRKISKKFQQDWISPTNCSSTKFDPFYKLFQKKLFLLQDNSLQINLKKEQILSTNRFPTNKFQYDRPFRLFPFLTWFGIKWLGRLICCETTNNNFSQFF